MNYNLHQNDLKWNRLKLVHSILVYDNDFTSIINIYFYETFSTLNLIQEALEFHSLDTLSDIRIKAFMLLF
jgi:hypothetical protein